MTHHAAQPPFAIVQPSAHVAIQHTSVSLLTCRRVVPAVPLPARSCCMPRAAVPGLCLLATTSANKLQAAQPHRGAPDVLPCSICHALLWDPCASSR